MPFRFRKSIKIVPGLKLNLSKSGVSMTTGVKGAHTTIGHGQVRQSVGLPGTGLSYTHVTPIKGKAPKPTKAPKQPKMQRLPAASPAQLWNYVCPNCGFQFQTPGGLVTCPHCGR